MSKRFQPFWLLAAAVLVLTGWLVAHPPQVSANLGSPPEVTTGNATDITSGSAWLNGSLASLGSAGSANVSFQWGTAAGNYTYQTQEQSVNSVAPFHYILYGLSGATTYYFRAKAVGDGTSYGTEKSFTTTIPIPPAPPIPPRVTTIGADNITTATARLVGELTELGDGGGNATILFQWGLSSYNYIDETPAISTNITGLYSVVITGLTANTTYYFRAWVIGPLFYGGDEMSFTTPAEPVPPPPFAFKWGSLGSGDGQFNLPLGLAVDSSDNIYVVDYDNNRIQKFTNQGAFISEWGISGTGEGQFRGPTGIAVDASNNVYVSDRGNNRVQKFTDSGQFITKWGTGGSADGEFYAPEDVAVDNAENIYIADWGNHRIQKFSSQGVFISKWGGLGSEDGQFNEPVGIAADTYGNVYVADYGNNRIEKFSNQGGFITKWGSPGEGDGQFMYLGRIAVDGVDNVYVSDELNNRIQKFTSSGSYITKWGSSGVGAGRFKCAAGISVGPSGNVYVADYYNNRIQVFGVAPPGTPPTVTTYRVFDFGTRVWLNGYLDSLGSAITTNVSFELGLSSGNYTIETPVITMNATGPFTWVAEGLASGTLYYFRTKAVGDGTSHGVEKVFATPVMTVPVVFGDANGDRLVNALDITKIERIIAGLDAESFSADANNDGIINALDITKVERIIIGLD